jgi:hypothetical protein
MKIGKFFFSCLALTVFICNLALASTCIVYSDNDYGCGWENYASPVTIQNSFEIGVNMVVYVAKALYAAQTSGPVRIMQVIHSGDYNTDSGSLEILVAKVNASTKVKAIFGGVASLGTTDLSNVNLLYITGHYPFCPSANEKKALKNYLDKGGFLFADDCSNILDNDGFESSFRNLILDMYGTSLEVLPADHGIYSSFYTLDGKNFSYTAKGNGTEWNQEPLEGYTFIKTIPATIDFDPDTFNLKSKGQFVTVYIELPSNFDVNNIDISTLKLNNIVNAEPAPTEIGDHDKDGISDLMVKFKGSVLHSEVGDKVKMAITGKLTNGTSFKGSDTIKVIIKN